MPTFARQRVTIVEAIVNVEGRDVIFIDQRETQFVERKLWDEKTATAVGDLKAKGVTFVVADKAAFYKATQPVRDKYGVKYAALLKRIDETK